MHAVITGAVAAGGAWAAVRTELRWLRRDVDSAHARLDALYATVAAHHRNNQIHQWRPTP